VISARLLPEGEVPAAVKPVLEAVEEEETAAA